MTHVCDKKETIEKIKDKLDKHIEIQIESDRERMQYRAERQVRDDEISAQLTNIKDSIQEVIELNKEINDLKTTWKVAKNMGIGLAAFITVLGVITGGVYAIKEWLRK